jgi:hypothetical protein
MGGGYPRRRRGKRGWPRSSVDRSVAGRIDDQDEPAPSRQRPGSVDEEHRGLRDPKVEARDREHDVATPGEHPKEVAEDLEGVASTTPSKVATPPSCA